MKVLHLISGGEKGGSRAHLLSLATQKKKMGIEPLIVCMMEGPLYTEALKLGLDIRLIKQARRFDLSIISRLREICIEEKIDIVNCHGGRANFLGFFLKRRYRAKYVSTIHSDYKEDYRGNTYKTIIFSNINRFVLSSFDYLITVSDSFKDMLVKRGFEENKIFVVYNGIDFNVRNKPFVRDEVVESFGLKNTSHYVSMIARFHSVKGHRVFMDACKEVLKYVKDVSFILVGDGDLRNELMLYAKELGIENSVFFVGFRDPDQFLSISDFTVMASYTESFPLSILESARYKKTVIATEVGGIPRLIEDGVNGCLFNPGDSITLSHKMLELLENPEKTEEMGISLYNKAKNDYSIEKFVQRYLEIYDDVMDRGER